MFEFLNDSDSDNEYYEYNTYQLLNQNIYNQYPKQITYKYCALDYLKQQLPENKISHHFIYNINTDGSIPFLEFYFEEDLGIMPSTFQLETRGNIIEDENVFIFYEVKEPLETSWIVDEIIYENNIPKSFIQVRDFLLRHPYCLLLEDEKGSLYETPVIAYREKNEDFIFDQKAIMGPYYYFSVEKLEENDNDKQEKEKDSYVLFLGKMKVPMNFPYDDYDKSLMKQELLNDTTNNIIRQTMRISDHDGNWTKDYDSVYLGTLELDDGSILRKKPCYVIKNLENAFKPF